MESEVYWFAVCHLVQKTDSYCGQFVVHFLAFKLRKATRNRLFSVKTVFMPDQMCLVLVAIYQGKFKLDLSLG